jgi:hypothetical protein
LIKTISPTPPNARDDQPRTSVPQLPLRRSVNPPGRGPLHLKTVREARGFRMPQPARWNGALWHSPSPARLAGGCYSIWLFEYWSNQSPFRRDVELCPQTARS